VVAARVRKMGSNQIITMRINWRMDWIRASNSQRKEFSKRSD